jgi:hypothetical protein
MDAVRVKFGHRFIEKNKESAKKADYSNVFENFLNSIKERLKESKESHDRARKERELLMRNRKW